MPLKLALSLPITLETRLLVGTMGTILAASAAVMLASIVVVHLRVRQLGVLTFQPVSVRPTIVDVPATPAAGGIGP